MTGNQTRILVVDDSRVSRTIITRTLENVLDNALVTATNSKQQVLELLAEGQHFDVITTALRLPDSNGLELTRAIRQSSSHQHVPIIVVSGDAASLDKAEMFAAGVTDSFDKSRGFQAFVAFIQTFLLRNVGLVGRVLYIENSSAAKQGLGLMEQHGMTVTHVSSAEEALERLQQSPYDFDVVVTDHSLAGEMNGNDLVATIRDHLHLTRVEMPTLALTDDDSEEVQARVLHAGANDLIAKPLSEALFITRLQSLISIKQLHDGLTRQADIVSEGLTRDPLTGLRNKRQVLDEAQQWLKDPAKRPVWIAHLSLDEFIKVNLSVGHARGDDALSNSANVMRKFLPEDALLARLAGVEFFAALPAGNRDHAIDIFGQLRKRVSAVRIGGEAIQLSVGLICADDHPYNELSSLLALTQFAANPSGVDGIRLVN